jgi:hypothetical protein
VSKAVSIAPHKVEAMSKRPTLTLPAPSQKLFALQPGSKQAVVLSMLLSPDGASIAELAKATKWEKHSIRGMVSRVLRKKLGLSVLKVRQLDRGTVYKLA